MKNTYRYKQQLDKKYTLLMKNKVVILIQDQSHLALNCFNLNRFNASLPLIYKFLRMLTSTYSKDRNTYSLPSCCKLPIGLL